MGGERKTTRSVKMNRSTKETDISLKLDMDAEGTSIATGLPFFDHLLHAMAYHGGFALDIEAKGDIELDPHHLVEDFGLVLGKALAETVDKFGPIARYGHSVIPMDDALCEVTLDAGGRPYLVYLADYPQEYCGAFHTPLIREFLLALANSARINLHAQCRYGENSHHIAEALFKALGRALSPSYSLNKGGRDSSTKGIVEK